MSEEQTVPVEQSVDTSKLEAELEAMRRKNAELIDEYKKAKAQAKAIPEGVDVQELLDFKQKAVQADLEQQGKYGEARQALEQQFREATAEKDKRISELEARVRELELITPAISALADVVHDPDLILKTSSPAIRLSVILTAQLSLLTAINARLSANGPRLCLHGCKSNPSHKAAEHLLAALLGSQ